MQDAVHDAVHHNVNYAWHKVRNHDLHRCSIMFSTMVCTVGILHYVECTMLGSVICSMLGRRVCPCFKQKNVKLIGIRKPLVIIFIMHACETLFKITYTVRCGLARLCKNAYNPTKTIRNFQNSQNFLKCQWPFEESECCPFLSFQYNDNGQKKPFHTWRLNPS